TIGLILVLLIPFGGGVGVGLLELNWWAYAWRAQGDTIEFRTILRTVRTSASQIRRLSVEYHLETASLVRLGKGRLYLSGKAAAALADYVRSVNPSANVERYVPSAPPVASADLIKVPGHDRLGSVLAIIGGSFVAIGSFFPWFSAATIGPVTRSGIEL